MKKTVYLGLTILAINFLFIGNFFPFITSVWAHNYYVAMNGNDSNNGSINAPWATILYAWKHSTGGDTVFVKEGTYSTAELWLQGNKNNFWTLKAINNKVVFSNTRFIVDANYVRIQGFHFIGSSFVQSVSWGGMHEHIEFIDNYITSSSSVSLYIMGNNSLVQGNRIEPVSAVHGIYVMHGNNNVIRNNNVKGVSKYGIHVYDENKYNHTAQITNLLIENNTVINSQTRSGIIISAGESLGSAILIDGVVVRNNILINNGSDGISIRYYGTVRNIGIYNNTIYGNTPCGLRISSYDVDNVKVINNIFSNTNGQHIEVSTSMTNFIVSHNLYWQPMTIGSGINDSHAVKQDPVFVNAGQGDFYLMGNSPAIDAGLDVGIPYGGVAPDLGAFEYGGIQPPPNEAPAVPENVRLEEGE